MVFEKAGRRLSVQERMAEEDRVREKFDARGHRWRKVYFGGGAHFENWLAQCKELGEVMVEEVDPTGYACFEASGEKLYRIWVKHPGPEGPALNRPYKGRKTPGGQSA